MIKIHFPSMLGGADIQINADTAPEAIEVLDVLFKKGLLNDSKKWEASQPVDKKVSSVKVATKKGRGSLPWTSEEIDIVKESVLSCGNGQNSFIDSIDKTVKSLKKHSGGSYRSRSAVVGKVCQFRTALFKKGRGQGYVPSSVKKSLESRGQGGFGVVPINYTKTSGFLGSERQL
jgi:hypothetical protein